MPHQAFQGLVKANQALPRNHSLSYTIAVTETQAARNRVYGIETQPADLGVGQIVVLMEELMRKRQKEKDDAYEAQWDNGQGSHHPDYDPYAYGEDVVKGNRHTEELYNAIVENDIKTVYQKIADGADVNFVFGSAYQCRGGYTPLMVASHRGRLECAKALLRAGADPNFQNLADDLTLFWAIDGGVEMIKLLHEYGEVQLCYLSHLLNKLSDLCCNKCRS